MQSDYQPVHGQARLLNTREAAYWTGLSRSSIEKLRLRGDGPPFIKLGSRVLYDPADLAAWTASCRCTSTSSQKG